MTEATSTLPPHATAKESDAPARPYLPVAKLVEDLFVLHGDSHQGLGYPKPDGFRERYRVYLDVTRFGPQPGAPALIVDVGCGTGRLLDEIKAAGRTDLRYRGVDLSEQMLKAARAKHPGAEFVQGDTLDGADVWADADYAVFGGLFTCRLGMTEREATDFMLRMTRLALSRCRRGIAFNVMSDHVDWRRDDLFHVPFDRMAEILHSNLTRNYMFRADYGLYEYTTYVYK